MILFQDNTKLKTVQNTALIDTCTLATDIAHPQRNNNTTTTNTPENTAIINLLKSTYSLHSPTKHTTPRQTTFNNYKYIIHIKTTKYVTCTSNKHIDTIAT